MNKQDRIQKFIKQCKELSDVYEYSKKKSEDLQTMVRMAREGLKETPEFKHLEWKVKQPTVVDFGGVVRDIVNTVKYL